MQEAYIGLDTVVLHEANVEQRSPVVSALEQQAWRDTAVLGRQTARFDTRINRLLGHVPISSPFAACKQLIVADQSYLLIAEGYPLSLYKLAQQMALMKSVAWTIRTVQYLLLQQLLLL